jgi:hypothetical protein
VQLPLTISGFCTWSPLTGGVCALIGVGAGLGPSQSAGRAVLERWPSRLGAETGRSSVHGGGAGDFFAQRCDLVAERVDAR